MDEETRKQRNREKSRKSYLKNLERNRQKSRERAKLRLADPTHREQVNYKKRAGGAGLTKAEWSRMFHQQGCRCAICGSDKPGAKAGWNTDHDHKTGKVRFILCAHCNRGLGAFRDNPEYLRNAARMLEQIQNNGEA